MNDGSESSNPSIAPELLENDKNLKSSEKMFSGDLSKLKRQMLMRKLALPDNCAPKLAKADSYVDIGAKEDEERDLIWLKGRFPPSHPSNSAKKSSTSCVVQRKEQKSEIMQKLSRQRREAQEKRKQLYSLDNEELFDEEDADAADEEDDDVEEEEEEEEDDEDEQREGEDEHGKEEDGVEDDCEVEEETSEQLEGQVSAEVSARQVDIIDEHDIDAKCDNSDNMDKKGAAHVEQLSSENTPPRLPDSLSQWFNRSEDRLHGIPSVEKEIFDEFIQMNELVGNGTASQSDLINLCSGNFTSQDSGESIAEEEEEDEVFHVRKRMEVISDDEEQDEMGQSHDGNADSGEEEDEDEERSEGQRKVFNRVVVDSDEDEEENYDLESETGEIDQVDSDDEMAVFRRQEKQREIRRDWLEEEAELSGDDIGSDGDDENDQLNQYEAEEGDLDTVPDEGELRIDLHKQLMKQQESSDHRELLQLRERLLGDDMSAVETNRTFRLKLREDEDGIGGGDDDEKKEEEEEAEDEVNIEAIKRRMEMEEKEVSGDEDGENKTSTVDVFSSISRSTTLSNKLGGRVRASLLHMDSSRMLGKENVTAKEKRNTFFLTKEPTDGEKDRECSESLPVKRKCTAANEKTNIKKSKPASLISSSLFSKFK